MHQIHDEQQLNLDESYKLSESIFTQHTEHSQMFISDNPHAKGQLRNQTESYDRIISNLQSIINAKDSQLVQLRSVSSADRLKLQEKIENQLVKIQEMKLEKLTLKVGYNENKNLKEELRLVKAELEENKQLVAEFRGRIEEKNQLLDNIVCKNRKAREKLQKQLQTALNQINKAEMQNMQLQIFQVQNRTLLRQIQSLKQTIKNHQLSKIALQSAIGEKDSMIEELRQNDSLIAQLKESINQKQADTFKLKKQLKQAKSEIDDLEQTLKEREKRISQLKESKVALQKQFDSQVERYSDKIKQLQSENIDMRILTNQNGSLRKEIESLRTQIRELEVLMTELRGIIKQKESVIEGQRGIEEVVQKYEAKLEQKNDQIKQLKIGLDEQRKQFESEIKINNQNHQKTETDYMDLQVRVTKQLLSKTDDKLKIEKISEGDEQKIREQIQQFERSVPIVNETFQNLLIRKYSYEQLGLESYKSLRSRVGPKLASTAVSNINLQKKLKEDREFFDIFCSEQYPNLKKLNLCENEGTQFNLDLDNLLKYRISESRINSASFTLLEQLVLNNNKLLQFPKGICNLRNLKKLKIHFNKIREIPQEIEQLTLINSLWLDSNQIQILPSSIGKLKQLKTLYLENNQISQLPDSITQLQNLTTFYIYNNKILSLPNQIGNLKKLSTFRCENNLITQLPASIGKLKQLKQLNLNGNKLSEFAFQICSLQSLQNLNLSNNQISQLPSQIDRLTKLKSLNLSRNLLSQICSQVTNLSLQILQLYSNKLEDLPKEIENLLKSCKLSLRENPLMEGTKDLLKKLKQEGHSLFQFD